MWKKGYVPWNKGKHPKYVQGSNHPRWKGGYKNNLPSCIDCGKKLTNPHNKRCRPCFYKSPNFTKNLYKKGKSKPDETIHPNWKGENVGYRTLHRWVEKHLGKPNVCEKCGTSNLNKKKIHWANKDHKYKRNLKDWLRLCSSCHKIYDLENRLSNH